MKQYIVNELLLVTASLFFILERSNYTQFFLYSCQSISVIQGKFHDQNKSYKPLVIFRQTIKR